jgi:hypothetical protein
MLNFTDPFWKKVNVRSAAECWLWQASYLKSGYGQHAAGVYAHRRAWELANGASIIPGRRNVVMHLCDRPGCVNPAHLRLGSHADNLEDMRAKGRQNCGGLGTNQARGVARPNARLTEVVVREIKRQLGAKVPQRKIAKALNISRGLVSDIVYGKSWTHVK